VEERRWKKGIGCFTKYLTPQQSVRHFLSLWLQLSVDHERLFLWLIIVNCTKHTHTHKKKKKSGKYFENIFFDNKLKLSIFFCIVFGINNLQTSKY